MTTNANFKSHIEAYLDLERQIAKLQEELKTHRTALVTGLNHRGKDTLCVDGYKVSHKEVTSKRVDTTMLKTHHPEIAQACTVEKKSMRFLVGLDKG